MRLKYLGTAAYEGIPGIFCDCEVCRESRKRGGKNIRTRSQALLDEKLLIDFPPDTYMHVLEHNLKLFQIYTCIITHSHSDHLYVQDISARQKGFAYYEGKPMTFYTMQAGYELIWNRLCQAGVEDEERIRVKKIQLYHSFEAEGYHITPLKADHDLKQDPVIYSIKKDGKSILYAHDTGYFPEETWEYLERDQNRYDCISLDCTEFYQECQRNHMSFSTCKAVKERLVKKGVADEHTKFILNHFSHNGKGLYEEMQEKAAEEGFIVSYDGMEVEI